VKSFVAQPSVMLVLVLLVAALVVVFFPDLRSEKGAAVEVVKAPVESAVPAVPVAPAVAPQASPAVGEKPVPMVEQVVAAKTPEPSNAAMPPAAAIVASAPVVQVVPVKPATVASAQVNVPSTAPVPGIIRFKASANAWVKVADSKGVVQFEKC